VSRPRFHAPVLLRNPILRGHGGHAPDPEGHVAWDCIGGADEWVGTKLTFDLTGTDDGLRCCSPTPTGVTRPNSWPTAAQVGVFLLSLKQLVETAAGTPFPEDLKF